MRGCLSVIVLALVFLTGAIWFGGPPIASAVVKATLTGTGFTSDTLEVEVTSDPPLKLAVGRADRVTIQATGVHWNDVRLATLSLRLGSVDLIARTAGTADGSLDGVQFSGPGGKPILADVVLSGAADSARTTITVDATSVSAAAVEAFAASFGLRPSAATLAAPDVIRVTLGGMSISGHLICRRQRLGDREGGRRDRRAHDTRPEAAASIDRRVGDGPGAGPARNARHRLPHALRSRSPGRPEGRCYPCVHGSASHVDRSGRRPPAASRSRFSSEADGPAPNGIARPRRQRDTRSQGAP